MRKHTRARIKPQGPQQPVLHDEVRVRECTLSWVVKPPSDFLFTLSEITEQMTLLSDSVYTKMILQFYTSLFHLPVPSVAANCLCCDASVLVSHISFVCPQEIFLLFEYLKEPAENLFYSQC